jgi:hypothetical protein
MKEPPQELSEAEEVAARAEWDKAWSSQPVRRLRLPLLDGLGLSSPFGRPVVATVSLQPPGYSRLPLEHHDRCPVCGLWPVGGDRLAASVRLRTSAHGSGLMVSVWVHPECFDQCEPSTESAPIPW